MECMNSLTEMRAKRWLRKCDAMYVNAEILSDNTALSRSEASEALEKFSRHGELVVEVFGTEKYRVVA